MNKNLDNLIENIYLIEEESIKANKIQELLEVIDSYEIEDYQLYYLKGCLWNLFPFDSPERDIEVESNLLKSISIKDDYIYSKTEFSFYLYDKKKYSKVIDILDDLDITFFEEKDQLWKSLKLQELLISSKLFICDNIDANLSSDFLGLISAYLNLSPIDIAVPRELVDSVIENKDKKGMSSIKLNTLSLVNSKNQKEYFNDEIREQLMN